MVETKNTFGCQGPGTVVTAPPEVILVADGDPLVRRQLAATLTRAGYRCVEADGADAALDGLASDPIDLVVLDIRMSGRTGHELLSEIKDRHPNVAVLMATTAGDAGLAIECMKSGAQGFISKPVHPEEVTLRVGQALDKRKFEREIAAYWQELERKVQEQAKQIWLLYLGAIEALVFALEARDKYVAGHSRRVAQLALAIGRAMGLAQESLDDLEWGGLLHDIGNVAVDPSIQNKPGKLTPEEYRQIRTHTDVGAGIVRPIVSKNVVDIIQRHHDHYRAAGYDQSTDGDDIPLGARIVAVADAFDAMTSERPYRQAIPAAEALDEIRRCAGTQFDPKVVRGFLRTPLVRTIKVH